MSDQYAAFFSALPTPIKVDVQDDRLVFAATGYFLELKSDYPLFVGIKAQIEREWELVKDKEWYQHYRLPASGTQETETMKAEDTDE